MFKGLFATKSLEMLAAEAKGENRLRRILGPVGLTSLGVETTTAPVRGTV